MAGMIIFIMNLCVPMILYFQLISQTLYPVLLAVIEAFNGNDVHGISLDPDFTKFSYSYTCIIIFVILFFLTMKKNLSIFMKINSFGVIPICIIVVFIIGIGFYSLTNTHYVFTDRNQQLDETTSYISLFNIKFPPLMGMLGGGFYLHNISLPIIRNSKNP